MNTLQLPPCRHMPLNARPHYYPLGTDEAASVLSICVEPSDVANQSQFEFHQIMFNGRSVNKRKHPENEVSEIVRLEFDDALPSTMNMFFGGCGDCRNVLATLYDARMHLYKKDDCGHRVPIPGRALKIVLNDVNPAILARAFVLFELLHRIGSLARRHYFNDSFGALPPFMTNDKEINSYNINSMEQNAAGQADVAGKAMHVDEPGVEETEDSIREIADTIAMLLFSPVLSKSQWQSVRSALLSVEGSTAKYMDQATASTVSAQLEEWARYDEPPDDAFLAHFQFEVDMTKAEMLSTSGAYGANAAAAITAMRDQELKETAELSDECLAKMLDDLGQTQNVSFSELRERLSSCVGRDYITQRLWPFDFDVITDKAQSLFRVPILPKSIPKTFIQSFLGHAGKCKVSVGQCKQCQSLKKEFWNNHVRETRGNPTLLGQSYDTGSSRLSTPSIAELMHSYLGSSVVPTVNVCSWDGLSVSLALTGFFAEIGALLHPPRHFTTDASAEKVVDRESESAPPISIFLQLGDLHNALARSTDAVTPVEVSPLTRSVGLGPINPCCTPIPSSANDFDVISTSNVPDYTGLLTALVHALPRLRKDRGIFCVTCTLNSGIWRSVHQFVYNTVRLPFLHLLPHYLGLVHVSGAPNSTSPMCFRSDTSGCPGAKSTVVTAEKLALWLEDVYLSIIAPRWKADATSNCCDVHPVNLATFFRLLSYLISPTGMGFPASWIEPVVASLLKPVLNTRVLPNTHLKQAPRVSQSPLHPKGNTNAAPVSIAAFVPETRALANMYIRDGLLPICLPPREPLLPHSDAVDLLPAAPPFVSIDFSVAAADSWFFQLKLNNHCVLELGMLCFSEISARASVMERFDCFELDQKNKLFSDVASSATATFRFTTFMLNDDKDRCTVQLCTSDFVEIRRMAPHCLLFFFRSDAPAVSYFSEAVPCSLTDDTCASHPPKYNESPPRTVSFCAPPPESIAAASDGAPLHPSDNFSFASDAKLVTPLIEKMRTEGNESFRLSAFADALRMYRRALNFCAHASVQEHRIPLWLNISACTLQLGDAGEALRMASLAVEEDSQCLKALFRQAKALIALNMRHELLVCTEKALHLSPDESFFLSLKKKFPNKGGLALVFR